MHGANLDVLSTYQREVFQAQFRATLGPDSHANAVYWRAISNDHPVNVTPRQWHAWYDTLEIARAAPPARPLWLPHPGEFWDMVPRRLLAPEEWPETVWFYLPSAAAAPLEQQLQILLPQMRVSPTGAVGLPVTTRPPDVMAAAGRALEAAPPNLYSGGVTREMQASAYVAIHLRQPTIMGRLRFRVFQDGEGASQSYVLISNEGPAGGPILLRGAEFTVGRHAPGR